MSDNKKRFRKKVANWFFPDNSDKSFLYDLNRD